MKNETTGGKLKRLFCMGPLILLMTLILEITASCINRGLPLPFMLPVTLKIALTVFFALLFVTVYVWFMVLLKRYSMGVTLIKQGPYRLVRHPLYAVFILFIPQFFIIWSDDYWNLIFWGIIIVLAHLMVKAEERVLLKTFGDEYTEYRKKVPALIPYKGLCRI